jgi:hypothetical protein
LRELHLLKLNRYLLAARSFPPGPEGTRSSPDEMRGIKAEALDAGWNFLMHRKRCSSRVAKLQAEAYQLFNRRQSLIRVFIYSLALRA